MYIYIYTYLNLIFNSNLYFYMCLYFYLCFHSYILLVILLLLLLLLLIFTFKKSTLTLIAGLGVFSGNHESAPSSRQNWAHLPPSIEKTYWAGNQPCLFGAGQSCQPTIRLALHFDRVAHLTEKIDPFTIYQSSHVPKSKTDVHLRFYLSTCAWQRKPQYLCLHET